MNPTNPYAFLIQISMQQIRDQEAKQRPTLTLIAKNERTCRMSTPKDQAIEPPAAPLSNREALDDIGLAINFLALGADALQGIGAMMQSEIKVHDEQLNQTRRSDLSAIFSFFGEALRAPAQRVRESVERL